MTKVINELAMKGAEVIFQDAHVSGHACQEEIKLIYSLVRPKYAIPIHGEFKHRKAQRDLALELGIPESNVFMMSSGDVLELNGETDRAKIVGKVLTGSVFVDGLGVGDVGNVVLRDRQRLSEDGIVIVVLTIEKAAGLIVAGPDVVSRGFVYVRESDELITEATEIVEEEVSILLTMGVNDWGKIKSTIRDALAEYLWRKIKRRPMIISIIEEI